MITKYISLGKIKQGLLPLNIICLHGANHHKLSAGLNPQTFTYQSTAHDWLASSANLVSVFY